MNIPLRAIIIDDEQRGVSALKQITQKFVSQVQVVAEFLEAAEAIPAIEQIKPEIVFLDINMPGMNGFEMLDRLQWRGFNLVFTTAHQEYGLKALKNDAFDYLLKPVDYRQLQATVERILEKRDKHRFAVQFSYEELLESLKRPRQKILAHSITGAEYIDLDEIIALESRSNYTSFLLDKNKELVTRKTLKEFEIQLSGMSDHFMRVHHSFIINLQKVQRFVKGSDEIVMTNDITIPLSKARREAFYKWMDI